MLWLHRKLGRFLSLLEEKVKRRSGKIASIKGEHCIMTKSQVSDAWQMLSHLKEELSHLK